jgi:hypothetical protein
MRPSLTITEATALLSACNIAQLALEQRLNSARKKNDFQMIGAVGLDYADLAMARRKLEQELAKETITPIPKSEDA